MNGPTADVDKCTDLVLVVGQAADFSHGQRIRGNCQLVDDWNETIQKKEFEVLWGWKILASLEKVA